MNDSERFAAGLQALKKKLNLGTKVAFAPTGSMPPPDPAMMGGGAPPMDPAMMGGAGAPPMDPSMMGGAGAPPMDPAMMGGGAPADPAMMGGAGAPPMDPAMMGGAPMDPSMMGAPPADPASMGVMPPPQEDPMEVLMRIEGKLDELLKLLKEPQVEDAKGLLPKEDAGKVEAAEQEQEEAEEPLSPEAADAVDNGESSFLRNQIKSLGGQA